MNIQTQQVDRKPCTKPFDGTENVLSTKQQQLGANKKAIATTVPLRFNYWMEHAHVNDNDISNAVMELFSPSPTTADFFFLSVNMAHSAF